MSGRHVVLIVSVVFVCLTACSPAKTEAPTQNLAIPTATTTELSALPTNTPVPPSDTPTPTEEPTRTASPTTTQPPTETLSPSPLPQLSGIGGWVLVFLSTVLVKLMDAIAVTGTHQHECQR